MTGKRVLLGLSLGKNQQDNEMDQVEWSSLVMKGLVVKIDLSRRYLEGVYGLLGSHYRKLD